ncbi:hypothetical protein H5410_059153 [Solanum commersonii]|uniref:Uncharacterized protein n=1 Tax=Solanum commersonii TaxID=4109 RepID=A0A9J5W1K3_SOLCO|nr:hypothetical protein H5410_059153 [Solanum commersonii]
MLVPGNVQAYLTSLYRRYKESSNKDQSTLSGEGTRDNIRRKLKVSPEEVNAIICKMPVAVLPRENLANILFIFEALHQLDHL